MCPRLISCSRSMVPCHLPAPLAIPPPAFNLSRFSCVATSLHALSVLATNRVNRLSMPRSSTSPKVAIMTSNASTRSGARSILLLRTSFTP